MTTHQFTDQLTQSVSVVASDDLRFRAGNLKIKFDDVASDYTANYFFNAMLKGIGNTSGFTNERHIGLSTTAPNPDGTNVTEPSVGGYARIDLDDRGDTYFPLNPTFSTPYYVIANDLLDIVFPICTADWGTVTHFVVYDAASAGNLLFYGALDSSKSVVNGTQPRFITGDLIFRVN
jgi:hypothetical protein